MFKIEKRNSHSPTNEIRQVSRNTKKSIFLCKKNIYTFKVELEYHFESIPTIVERCE